MRTNTYTNDELIASAIKSTSIAECMRNLGLEPTGGNYSRFHAEIKMKNIDISHFNSGVNRKSHNKLEKDDFINRHCVDNSNITSYRLKTKLIEFGVLDNCCCKCGNVGIWDGNKLVLELDHIDGNRKNCKIVNLRILCPNCHSQTETFGNKNIIRY